MRIYKCTDNHNFVLVNDYYLIHGPLSLHEPVTLSLQRTILRIAQPSHLRYERSPKLEAQLPTPFQEGTKPCESTATTKTTPI